MVDLTRRATEVESLDRGIPEVDALANLDDLRMVHGYLGDRPHLLAAVQPHLEAAARISPPLLLDVGCGSADLSAWLRARTSPPGVAVAVDLKVLHLRQAPLDVRCVAADARALPFPSGTFDVVTASHFLHHVDGPEVAAVLRELYRLTRRVLVISDLRRALVPYLFGQVAFPFIFRSHVTVADGLLSIRRAFTRAELEAAFRDAGIRGVVQERWPYHLLAVAERSA